MNAKSLFLIVGLMAFSHQVAFPVQMTAKQEIDRINTLWNLYEHNMLTIVQFKDSEDINATIDNDILMLEKHKSQILTFKNSIGSAMFDKIVSGGLKTIAVTSAALAGIGFLSSASGSYAMYHVLDDPNDSYGKFYFTVLKEIFGTASKDYMDTRLTYLTQQSPDKDYNSGVLIFGAIMPLVLVGSALFALLSRYTFKKHADWNSVDMKKEWQEQLNRHDLLIAKLKQIKYENGL